METAGDIRDIKGLVPLPTDWWVWALVALVAMTLVAVALYFLLRKKSSAPPSKAGIQLTAYDIAVQALQRLAEEDLIGRGEADRFYTRLSDIVRHYLEGHFQLHAPERTTEEFLYEVSQNSSLSQEHKGLLGAFLQECDLVKFARLRPSSADMKRALDAAERFVHDTRPRLREQPHIVESGAQAR